MQKKIIALAVAGLMSGAAFAQSNVTIYGAMDATFDSVSSNGAAAGANDLDRRNRVSGNSSFLGFKGSEDLGNGMKAIFQIEGSLASDNAGGFGGTNRDTYVGLTGNFGTVVAGNLTGPTRALGAGLDPFAGATGITANTGLLGKLGGGAGTSMFDTRWANSVAYISPDFNGFTAVAAYVANENKTRDGLDGVDDVAGVAIVPGVAAAVPAVPGERDTSGYDLGLKYNNGPIMAAISYNRVSVGDTTSMKLSDLRIGGKYDFGQFTIGLMWDRVKYDDNAGGDTKRSAWFIPVTFNVTANGKIVGQYGKAGDLSNNGALNEGAKMWALGYEHSLSKRTVLKAVYSKISNERDANYDFGVNAVNGTPAVGADPSGFQFGIRHTF
jgi:predicted porin